MKKLLLLALVLLGGITQVSADTKTITVYVKAANAPRIHVWGTGTGEGVTSTDWGTDGAGLPSMEETTLNGITVYKYDVKTANDDFNCLFKYVAGYQSQNIEGISGNCFYDWDGNNTSPTRLDITWTFAANRHLAANYDNWDGSSANNIMTSTDNTIFTIKIENKAIKAGTYGYKFVGDYSGWIGNNGNNYTITISESGYYDITYTFNGSTKTASDPVIEKKSSADIEYKYFVYDNDAEYWVYDGANHITPLTDENWTACEMTSVNGTFVYGISGKALTSGNRYGARLVEKVIVNGASVQDNFPWIGDNDGGSQGCRYYDCTTSGTYDIVLSYNPSETNYDLTSAQPKLSVNQGLYAANSSNWGTSGKAMTFDAAKGVYKTTLENMNNLYFALSTNSNIEDNWSTAIRPQYDDNEGARYDVNFMTYSGTGATGGKSSWYVTGEGVNVEISYRPTDAHWEVTPYRTATIGAAGYITYSNGEKCTVSDADAIYVVSDKNESSVHLQEMSDETIWPAREGMILKGTEDDVITIKAVAYDATATAIGNNYLVGSGNSSVPLTKSDNIYIFNWDGSDTSSVGFYKISKDGTLGAHKAYLDLSLSFNARDFLGFDFENGTTGVNTVQGTRFNVQDSEYYNLNGQRVAQPTKGLYLVNGRKVVIK